MQAQRKVRVKVPGKHFPGLVAAEQREMCWGTAVGTKRSSGTTHKFAQHLKVCGEWRTPGRGSALFYL